MNKYLRYNTPEHGYFTYVLTAYNGYKNDSINICAVPWRLLDAAIKIAMIIVIGVVFGELMLSGIAFPIMVIHSSYDVVDGHIVMCAMWAYALAGALIAVLAHESGWLRTIKRRFVSHNKDCVNEPGIIKTYYKAWKEKACFTIELRK